MKYINLYSNHQGYVGSPKTGTIKPNVSQCLQEDHLHYEMIHYARLYNGDEQIGQTVLHFTLDDNALIMGRKGYYGYDAINGCHDFQDNIDFGYASEADLIIIDMFNGADIESVNAINSADGQEFTYEFINNILKIEAPNGKWNLGNFFGFSITYTCMGVECYSITMVNNVD